MKKLSIGVLASVLSAWGLTAAEIVYTMDNANWGTALTVASGDTAVLEAPERTSANWGGTVSVAAGGTLKTRGNVTVSGATTIAAGGVVDVESGKAYFTFGSVTMAGDLYVRSGAQLDINRTDAIAYSGTVNLHIYGTYNCAGYRTSIGANNKLFLYDGARLLGTGDGNGGFDFFADNRVVARGTVAIEVPFKVRTSGQSVDLACFEDAEVKFLGGFVASSAGTLTKVAATAAEGNTAGTCANAKLEIGPSYGAGPLAVSGAVKYTLNGNATNPVAANGALDLELVATLDREKSQHLFALTAPTITCGEYAVSVRLSGNGVVKLPTATPDYKLVLGGAGLQLDAGTPLTLAAGSSIVAATQLNVAGMVPGETYTFIDGPGAAALDPSLVTVRPTYNGAEVGTVMSTALTDGAIVIANVPEFTKDGWITPYLRRTALIWLDASNAANFIFNDAAQTVVAGWKDLSDYHRNATARTVANMSPAYGTLGIAAGVPAYIMGAESNGVDLGYTRMTTIQSAFWVMSIRTTMQAFWLGDASSYNFHRGSNGQYSYTAGGNETSSFWCDGVKVNDVKTDTPPTDRHVYSSIRSGSHASDRLTGDRDGCASRHSGREISELICLPVKLSDADRQDIEQYLAAKWMGSNPTAGGSAVPFNVDDNLDVGMVSSTAYNYNFDSGASITFDPDALTTASTALATSGSFAATDPVEICVNAGTLQPGSYRLLAAGSGITSLDQFSANLIAPAGGSATLTLENGVLTLVVADSSVTGPLTWRPQNSDDLAWSATSLNWLLPDSMRSGFINGLDIVFDGAESVSGDIAIDETYRAGSLTMTGAKDYTFVGEGALNGSSPISLNGTGTVLLDGPNLDEQEITIGPGRTVRLGDNAGANSLGSRNATLKVAGGTLDINYNLSAANNNAARCSISHRKRIELSNGGSLVNNTFPCCGAFGDITVLDTGRIGGTMRMDIRNFGGDPDCTTTTVTGDDNAVLTVANANTIGFYNAQVNIGRIDIVQTGTTGRMRIEQPNGVYNVTDGIHLADGARLSYWAGKSTAGANVHVDEGVGRIEAESGECTMEGKLVVAEGATAQFASGDASGTLNYLGKLENSGSLDVNGATHRFRNELPENFTFKLSGGAAHLTGDITGAKTVTVTDFASGYLGIVCNDTYGGIPAIERYVVEKTGGEFDLLPQKAGISDLPGVIEMNSSGGATYVYGPNWSAEYGIAAVMNGTLNIIGVGIESQRPGTLKIKEGSEVVVGSLYNGDHNKSPATGKIVIDPGATVEVTTNLRNGHWHTAPEKPATHTIDIGGVLDASKLLTYNPYDSPRSQIILREGGVFKTKGFNARSNYPYNDGVSAGDGRQWFLMEGGRLELGESGFTGNTNPGVCKYDFQNGEIVNVAKEWGGTQGFPLFFGYEKVGGSVTFDLATYFVNWNTGLAGASEVTLKGSANFQGNRPLDRQQGALLGKFTVENTAGNDLTTAGVFGGGLKLADGVNAKVAKYSDQGYLCALSALAAVDYAQNSVWSYPYASMNFFNYVVTHGNCNSVFGRSGLYVHGRGEFYVPAEKAGTWTFVGNFDDKISFNVDGTQLFKTDSWSAMGKGQIELTTGWHKFTMSVYGGGGDDGPAITGFLNRMAVGYLPAASDSTNGNDYTPFLPGGELQIRPYANACIWSYRNAATEWDTTDDWTHMKAMPTMEYMHKGSGLADANTFKGWFASKVNRFEGWFKVEDDQAGTWTFNMGYDDDKLLNIDGERVVNTTTWSVLATGSKALTPGWHRWEVRVHDGSGGWGVVATVNNGNTLSYIAPGANGEEKQFNEVNLKLAATLGDIAVLEPTGIYKELELGEGATLTSDGPMAMPIFGTLKGNGTLAGSFAFAGDHNAWAVEGVGNQRTLTSCAEFANATAATFTGLKCVKATFDGKPVCGKYVLAPAPEGLTTADLANVATEVTDGKKDYSSKFSVQVKDGNVVLVNRAGGGITFLIR